MTRFNASGPRVQYTPVPRDNLSEKVLGIYGMWAALSPETREKIANWFRHKGSIETDSLDPNLDMSLIDQETPELGKVDMTNVLTGSLETEPSWLRRISQNVRESYEDNGPSFANTVPGERPRAYIKDPEMILSQYRDDYRKELLSSLNREAW